MYNAMHPLVMLLIHGLLNSPIGDFFSIWLSLVAVWRTSLTHKTYNTTSWGVPLLPWWSCSCFLSLYFWGRCFHVLPSRFLIGIRVPSQLQTKVFAFFFSLPWQCSNVCCVLTHFCRSAERWIEVVTPSLRPTVAAAWTCNDSGLHSASAAFTSDGTAQ